MMVGLNLDPKDPNHEWRLRLRTLKEAAECIEIAKLNSFRPNHTIWHNFDKTTKENAFFVANSILDHQQEFLETINAHCIIALVSADVSPHRKTHIINLTIKWLLQNQIDSHTFHHILQSIHAPHLTFQRLCRVRLGIYIYMTTSELINHYDIYYEHAGSLCIRRKSDVPDDPAVFGDSDFSNFCKSINGITDNYYNPFWPEGTYRKDPEAPVLRKGKIHFPVLSIGMKPSDLLNPCFKWDFDIKGTPFEGFREPVAHVPAVDRPTILAHDPRAALKKYKPADRQKNPGKKYKKNIAKQDSNKVEPGVKNGFDFSPLPKKFEKLTGRNHKNKYVQKHRKISNDTSIRTETTTSGYGSLARESTIGKMKPEYDILTDFEKKCSISGSQLIVQPTSSSHPHRTSQHTGTSSQRTSAKIPVKTRPGGKTVPGNKPKYYRNDRGNRNHDQNHYKKPADLNNFESRSCNLPNSSFSQKCLSSAHEKITTSKSVAAEHIKRDDKPQFLPQFFYDPIRNIIQKNY